MINTILIFPIIACILVLLIKNKTFNTWMVNLYAVVHIVASSLLVFGKNTELSIPYFALDHTNAMFLLVLSFVYLMVAIYNTGYVKNIDVPARRISHYSFMIMRHFPILNYIRLSGTSWQLKMVLLASILFKL